MDGQPMMCGVGRAGLPPSYVRSVELTNTTGDSVQVEVSFKSREQELHFVGNGETKNVEKSINHGNYSTVDAVTSFKVMSASNGEETVGMPEVNGIERLRFNIGTGPSNGLVVSGGLAPVIAPCVMPPPPPMPTLGGGGGAPSYVRSVELENTSGDSVQVEVNFQSGEKEMHFIVNGVTSTVEKSIDHGSYSTVDAVTSFKVMSASNGEETVGMPEVNGIERLRFNIGTGPSNGLVVSGGLTPVIAPCVMPPPPPMPTLGGGGGAPSYVRSVELENTSGDSVQVEVNFQSGEKEMHFIVNGVTSTVEKSIDHGSYSTVDPVTSFKVMSSSNAENSMPVQSTGGIQRHRYNIGVGAANGLEITNTVL